MSTSSSAQSISAALKFSIEVTIPATAGRSAAIMGRIDTAQGWLERILSGRDLGTSLHGELSYSKYDLRVRIAGGLRGSCESCGWGYIRIGIHFQHVEGAARVGAHIDARIVATADAGVAPESDLLDAVFETPGDLRGANRHSAPVHRTL